MTPTPATRRCSNLLLWGLEEGGLKWPHREGLEEPYHHFLERLAVQDDQEEAYCYLVEYPGRDHAFKRGTSKAATAPRRQHDSSWRAFRTR